MGHLPRASSIGLRSPWLIVIQLRVILVIRNNDRINDEGYVRKSQITMVILEWLMENLAEASQLFEAFDGVRFVRLEKQRKPPTPLKRGNELHFSRRLIRKVVFTGKTGAA